MSNVTVIIPIHKMDDNISNYLNNAVKSLDQQKVKPDEYFIDLFGIWFEDFKLYQDKRNEPLSRHSDCGERNGSY